MRIGAQVLPIYRRVSRGDRFSLCGCITDGRDDERLLSRLINLLSRLYACRRPARRLSTIFPLFLRALYRAFVQGSRGGSVLCEVLLLCLCIRLLESTCKFWKFVAVVRRYIFLLHGICFWIRWKERRIPVVFTCDSSGWEKCFCRIC